MLEIKIVERSDVGVRGAGPKWRNRLRWILQVFIHKKFFKETVHETSKKIYLLCLSRGRLKC
jgi:hypothetical protein